MKKQSWQVLLGLSLVLVSALAYLFQIQAFHRTSDTIFYMIQDLAFLPIQVLLVTLVVNSLLRKQESTQLRYKLNMVIGAFFVAVGNDLLQKIVEMDENAGDIVRKLAISQRRSNADFRAAMEVAQAHKSVPKCNAETLSELKSFTVNSRPFVLRLLENGSLMEHESFTDMLWAVSHLMDELDYRPAFDNLPRTDILHLASDIQRAYTCLLCEWLAYTEHLREQYPYMYSLIQRVNPLSPGSSAVVSE
jgi:hypothetical protein